MTKDVSSWESWTDLELIARIEQQEDELTDKQAEIERLRKLAPDPDEEPVAWRVEWRDMKRTPMLFSSPLMAQRRIDDSAIANPGVPGGVIIPLYAHPPAPELPGTDGSILAALRKSHEAGGNAWDDIDDPEAFVRELRGGPPPSPWHSVDDKLPETGIVVQVWPQHLREVGLVDSDGIWVDTNERVIYTTPTHWYPLTQGPEVTT